MHNLILTHKPVDATAGPVTTNGGVTGDYISLKDAEKVTIVVQLTQAVAHATAITPKQATDVSGSDVKVLSNACRIWANEATGTSDTLVAQTAATSYTVTADIAKKIVVFEIIPGDSMDVDNSFDCLGLLVADSSEATNFVSAIYWIEKKTRKTTPPTDITD